MDELLAALPKPSPEAQAHSDRVVRHIRAEIDAAGGWISFARFMELALYAPGLGYYTAGASKFGAAGDFVTAPEISPLFSRCLAGQCAEVFEHLGGGDILELGPGSGVMAADMLLELERLDALPECYRILELSADLRERQRRTLCRRAAHLMDRVHWLSELPEPTSGVVIGNEVLDALPVERFEISDGEILAAGVAWRDGLCIQARVAGTQLASCVEDIRSAIGARWPGGYQSEVRPMLPAWVASVADSLARGVFLLVDYGLPRREYYLAERCRGTLMCHYRHRAHDDPLLHVGLQDISAWVDFSAVAESAAQAGLTLAGFATQAHFLLGAGLDRQLEMLASDVLHEQLQLARQAKTLTLPGEMGERFKVIGLRKACDIVPSAFHFRDLSTALST